VLSGSGLSAEISIFRNNEGPAMKIEDALAMFITQLEANGRSFHTVKQYVRHIRLFSHWAHEDRLYEDVSLISHEDIARFLISRMAKLRPDGDMKKAATMNALRSSIKGFFQYLHQAGYINQDPTILIKRATCGTPPPRILSSDDKTRLMNALSSKIGFHTERDAALFQLMLDTGIRLSSALALNIEDINLDQGEIRIWMKGDQYGHVYLNSELQSQLKSFIAEKTTGPLFTCLNSKRLSQRHVQRRFSMWLKKAEITRSASCHSLRHTFATRLYQRTGDVFLVQSALHHRSITSTLIYAQKDESRLKAALQV